MSCDRLPMVHRGVMLKLSSKQYRIVNYQCWDFGKGKSVVSLQAMGLAMWSQRMGQGTWMGSPSGWNSMAISLLLCTIRLRKQSSDLPLIVLFFLSLCGQSLAMSCEQVGVARFTKLMFMHWMALVGASIPKRTGTVVYTCTFKATFKEFLQKVNTVHMYI